MTIYNFRVLLTDLPFVEKLEIPKHLITGRDQIHYIASDTDTFTCYLKHL